MADNIVEKLFISFGINNDDVDKGLQQFGSKIDNGLKTIVSRFIVPFAAALSFKSLFGDYLKDADELGKFADQIGADIQDLQYWGNAVASAGGSAEGFRSTVERLTGSLSELSIKGTSRAKQYLDELGVQGLDPVTGKARDTFEVLKDISGAIEDMDKQQSSGILSKIGLDAGTIRLLQSGKVALDDVLKRQQELGAYTKEDAELTAQLNDAFSELGQSLKTVLIPVFRLITPLITSVTNTLTDIVVFVRQNSRAFEIFFGALAIAITALALPAIASLGAALWSALAPILPILIPIVAIFGILALVIDDFFGWMEGKESTFGDVFEEWFGNVETAREAVELFAETWKAIGGFILDVLKGIIGLFAQLIVFIIKKLAQFVVEGFSGIRAFVNAFIDGAGNIRQVFGALFDWLADKFSFVTSGLGKIRDIAAKFGFGGEPTAGTPGSPQPVGSQRNETVVNQDTQVSIGNVTIETQATDAQGIARDFGSQVVAETRNSYEAANNGVRE